MPQTLEIGKEYELTVSNHAQVSFKKGFKLRDPIAYLNPREAVYIRPSKGTSSYWNNHNLKKGQRVRVCIDDFVTNKNGRVFYFATLIKKEDVQIKIEDRTDMNRNSHDFRLKPVNEEDMLQREIGRRLMKKELSDNI